MTTIHTVQHSGQTFTRKSKDRSYSHVVLARPSYEHALRIAKGGNPTLPTNFDFYRSFLDGSNEHMRRKLHETAEDHETRIDRDRAKAIEALGGAETLDQYVANRIEAAIAAVEERKAAGEFDRFVAYSWASKLELATAEAARRRRHFIWAEVVVVPTEQTSKEQAA